MLMVALAADATAAKYVAEATDASRLLRHVARPAPPITLFANPCFRSLLPPGDATLWDSHRPLRLADALRPFVPAGYEDDLVGDGCAGSAGAYQSYRGAMLRGGALRGDHPLKIKAFVLKISAMMSVEYGRALFLDLDVYVLSPGLPHELLSSALRAADVAMPGPVPERHTLVDAALTEATRSVLVLCSCLVAFRATPAALAWMRDAARGILCAERPELKRQGIPLAPPRGEHTSIRSLTNTTAPPPSTCAWSLLAVIRRYSRTSGSAARCTRAAVCMGTG